MQKYSYFMQYWFKTHAAPQQIAILLFDGFSNHCLANTIEPLRAANMLTGKELYVWRVLALTRNPVLSSSGLQVTPEATLSSESGDMLAVMPSYGFRTYTDWKTQSALRAAANRFATLTAMDTGSWLLAEAGLLSNRQATIHWEELTAFSERFPDIEVLRERYVIDGNRITCSGAMAAFDLISHLIARDQGHALALEVAQLFMMGENANRAFALGPGKSALNRALAIMQAHLETPLSIPDIARQAGVTQRTLETRMQREFGAGPARVYRRLRLNLARKLVKETDLSVSEIALRSGYENASAMTRAFRNEFGQPPRATRENP